MKISQTSPAKLNLFLLITGRRHDGYHNIQTCFQFIDLCDELTFELTDDQQIHLSTPIVGIDNSNNLIIRAANLLKAHVDVSHGCVVTINKCIPIGAGLGGGSSNAATTLLALNKLWQLDLSLDELADLGMQLGADVPVFIHGHAAWAQGIGEQLYPIPLTQPWYLVVKPACEVSTEEIYSHPRLTRASQALKIGEFPVDGRNDCQSVVCECYPDVQDAINWLAQYGDAKLTGTGSAVFAAFDDLQQAEQAQAECPKTLANWLVKGHNSWPR